MASQTALVNRTYKQLSQLNELVLRYTSRQQSILETLKYCMTTLHSLEGWAVFAIFPSDNAQDGQTYTACVEQRFQYCSSLLHYFSDAVTRLNSQQSAVTSEFYDSPRDSNGPSPRDQSTAASCFSPSPRSTCTAASDPAERTSRTVSVAEARRRPTPTPTPTGDGSSSLRQQISALAKSYIEDGVAIQTAVVEYLQRRRMPDVCMNALRLYSGSHLSDDATKLHLLKHIVLKSCHKRLIAVLQWGLKSTEQLKLIIDDAMSEMLVFTVKSRMWRLMSTIGELEEAARKVQQTMSQQDTNQPGVAAPGGAPQQMTATGITVGVGTMAVDEQNSTVNSLKDSGIVVDSSSLSSLKHNTSLDRLIGHGDSATLSSVTSPLATESDNGLHSTEDWRKLYLNNWVIQSSSTSSSRGANSGAAPLTRGERILDDVDEEGLATFRSDASNGTPEPPTSPRPLALVRHPKIGLLRDKLHRSITLPPGSMTSALQEAAAADESRSLQASWNISTS